jgi:hypothetical protein
MPSFFVHLEETMPGEILGKIDRFWENSSHRRHVNETHSEYIFDKHNVDLNDITTNSTLLVELIRKADYSAAEEVPGLNINWQTQSP